MSVAFAAAAVLGLLAWCWASGHGLLHATAAYPEDPGGRHALALVAGLVLLHLLLLGADVAGVPWTRAGMAVIGAAVLISLTVPLRAAWRARGPGATPRWSWADGAALAALTAFMASSLALRSPFTDFVYHWGLKGHRFFLAHGIDEAFLARPENGYLHPDYPNLLPESFAAAALLAGRFEPVALMLFTPFFVLAALAAIRATLLGPDDGDGLPRAARRAIFAGLACALCAFCIGYLQAGSADPPFALAVALAGGALLRPPDRGAALQLGLAAAFACAIKIEGAPFALLAIGAFVARALTGDRRALRAPSTWVALIAPTLLVAAPWWLEVRALGLFQDTNTGGLVLARAGDLVAPLWRQTFVEEWLGLPLLLLALPLVAWARTTRWLGLLLLGQLAFYLFAYLSAPFDPIFYVLSTFPRLALHLLPAAVVGLTLALAGPHDPPRPVAWGPPRAGRRGSAVPAFRSLTRRRADLETTRAELLLHGRRQHDRRRSRSPCRSIRLAYASGSLSARSWASRRSLGRPEASLLASRWRRLRTGSRIPSSSVDTAARSASSNSTPLIEVSRSMRRGGRPSW